MYDNNRNENQIKNFLHYKTVTFKLLSSENICHEEYNVSVNTNRKIPHKSTKDAHNIGAFPVEKLFE